MSSNTISVAQDALVLASAPSDQQFIADALESRGHIAFRSSDLERAIVVVRSGVPLRIVAVAIVPSLDPLELLKQLQNEFRNCGFISAPEFVVVSLFPSKPEIRKEAKLLGAHFVSAIHLRQEELLGTIDYIDYLLNEPPSADIEHT